MVLRFDAHVHQSTLYHNQLKKSLLARLEDKVDILTLDNAGLSAEAQTSENLRLAQLGQADYKRKYEKTQNKNQQLYEVEAGPPQVEEGEEEEIELRLKNEHGHFQKEAIVCVMSLLGECEVPG